MQTIRNWRPLYLVLFQLLRPLLVCISCFFPLPLRFSMAHFATLNTGASIPLVGMGTADDGAAATYNEKKAAMSSALQVGYTHFDTASLYNSEGYLGEALQEAMEAGTVKREDLFITSKLWCIDAYPEGVLPALQKSLSTLKLDYLDLYLVHWPMRIKEGAVFPPAPDAFMDFDMKGTWGAMEDCVRKGLTKAIGVSNFSSKKILDLLEFAVIPPAVNQVEMHPKWQQQCLRETCKKFDVHVSAWSPLRTGNTPWGYMGSLDDPLVKEIAAKHNKSPAQVVLRWALDKGVSVLPKSFNKKRMEENLQVFGWSLEDEDHHKLSKIEQKKNLDGSFFCSPTNGPYRNPQDLWDGEV